MGVLIVCVRTITMRIALLLLCSALVASVTCFWAPAEFDVEAKLLNSFGRMNFVRGQLGKVDYTSDDAVKAYIQRYVVPMAELTGNEVFALKSNFTDFVNDSHLKYQEYFVRDGAEVEVDGGELIVHVKPDGSVFAVNGDVLPETTTEQYAKTTFNLAGREAVEKATQMYKDAEIVEGPTPVVLLHEGEGRNSYRAVIQFDKEGDIVKSEVHVCPMFGDLFVEFPLFHPALNRTIYDAQNGLVLPGTLVRTETDGPSSDVTVNEAYDNAGVCYDFYMDKFGRDSWDGNGADMISTVHYREGYNNAFWNGQQMVYGDGDGVTFTNFAEDLSVVCHELTHAVVQSTANLRYQGESGALNEGIADIMGSSAVIFQQGALNPTTWDIGPDCYIAGWALRYMANPTQDGASRDYYPTRYTGILDNGGVHWNSGIANLYFVLSTQGGVHPQQSTTNYVNGVGIDYSQQVVYSALTSYLTETSNFANAAFSCITAAQQLYGDKPLIAQNIEAAWSAVGVSPSSS